MKEGIGKTIFSWIYIIFCLLSLATYGISLATILLLLTALAAIPLKPVRNVWKKLLHGKRMWMKPLILFIVFGISARLLTQGDEFQKTNTVNRLGTSSIPEISSEPYVELNDNIPLFTEEELVTTAFENYSPLDSLGRCGEAYANICVDIMPVEERGEIGMIKPAGWHTVKYDIIDGKYLYNRCHLIAFRLAGENANTENLITGTRYLNIAGMAPFEKMVADYVTETQNHVLYRVTPVFEGNNLIASGVLMEAMSVEDEGEGICFYVYCYNVQPGITIDYATGDSALAE